MPASAKWVREGILAKYVVPAKVNGNGKSVVKAKTAANRAKAAKAAHAKEPAVKVTSKTGKPVAKKTSRK
jgi:hypothetical protein